MKLVPKNRYDCHALTFPSIFIFHKILKLFQRATESCNLPAPCPNPCNHQDWAALELEAENLIWVSHGRLRPSPATSPRVCVNRRQESEARARHVSVRCGHLIQ